MIEMYVHVDMYAINEVGCGSLYKKVVGVVIVVLCLHSKSVKCTIFFFFIFIYTITVKVFIVIQYDNANIYFKIYALQ